DRRVRRSDRLSKRAIGGVARSVVRIGGLGHDVDRSFDRVHRAKHHKRETKRRNESSHWFLLSLLKCYRLSDTALADKILRRTTRRERKCMGLALILNAKRKKRQDFVQG